MFSKQLFSHKIAQSWVFIHEHFTDTSDLTKPATLKNMIHDARKILQTRLECEDLKDVVIKAGNKLPDGEGISVNKLKVVNVHLLPYSDKVSYSIPIGADQQRYAYLYFSLTPRAQFAVKKWVHTDRLWGPLKVLPSFYFRDGVLSSENEIARSKSVLQEQEKVVWKMGLSNQIEALASPKYTIDNIGELESIHNENTFREDIL
ncbi:MAG: hypothetical protein EOO43_19980, partial [Flavobacterium sp.]